MTHEMKQHDQNDWEDLFQNSKNLMPSTQPILNRNTLSSLTNEANRMAAQASSAASQSETVNWYRQRGINLQQPQITRRVDISRIHEIPSGITRGTMDDRSLIHATSTMAITQKRKKGLVPTDNQLIERYIPPYNSAVSGRFLDLRPFLKHRHEHSVSATIQEAQLRHARYFREKYCENYEEEWDKSRGEILKSISSGGNGPGLHSGYGLNVTSVGGSVVGDVSFINDASSFGGGLSSIYGHDMTGITGFGGASTFLDPRSASMFDGPTMMEQDATMVNVSGVVENALSTVSKEYCLVMRQFAEYRKNVTLTIPASSSLLSSTIAGRGLQPSASTGIFVPFDAYRRTNVNIAQRLQAQGIPSDNLSTLFEVWSLAGTMLHEGLYESEPSAAGEAENIPPYSNESSGMSTLWNYLRGSGGNAQAERIVPTVYPSPKIEPEMNAYAEMFHEYNSPGVSMRSDSISANLGLKRLHAFGGRRYLERMYLDHISRYIDERPEHARLGGEINTRAYILAFLRCLYADGVPQEFKHTIHIDNEAFPLWACIYMSFRVGDIRTALDFASSHRDVSMAMRDALATIDRVYEGYSALSQPSTPPHRSASYVRPDVLVQYFQRNDLVLEETLYDRLKEQYDGEVTARNDPYEMSMYALLGLCGSTLSQHEIPVSGNPVSNYTVQHVEDYLWVKLCTLDLHGDRRLPYWVDRHSESNLPFRVSTLEELQASIFEMGADHFDESRGQNPFIFTKILLLTQQFERAVEFLYSKNRLVEAVHLGVALQFYGCLGTGLDLRSKRTNRTEIHQHVSELIVQLIEKESMVAEAFYYTYMIDGNNDVRDSASKCIETLIRYVSEKNLNIFSTYLGSIEREASVQMTGLIPQYFSVDQTRRIGIEAGHRAKSLGNDEHAVKLFVFCGDFDSAGRVMIQLLSHVVMSSGNAKEKKNAEALAVRVFKINEDASKYIYGRPNRMEEKTRVNVMRGIGLCEFFDAYLDGPNGYPTALEFASKHTFVPLSVGNANWNTSEQKMNSSFGGGNDPMMLDDGAANLSMLNSGISGLLHERNSTVMKYKDHILMTLDERLSKYIPDVCVAVMTILSFQIEVLRRELAFDTRHNRSILPSAMYSDVGGANGTFMRDPDSQERQKILKDKSAQCELIERFYSEISTTILSTGKCDKQIQQLFSQTRLS